ncbi:hypothetical protein [Catalinimonas alkaloidigena]|nr:hypothetical protein [Catalinimonas alkaloidigena]
MDLFVVAGGIAWMLCLPRGLPAQDLATLGQQKPLTLTGGLSVRTVFYQAHGIEARRKPFSYVVSGAPVLSVYGWSIPVSFVFSEQERSFRQPFNQFGMSPTYKWLTFHAGYRNLQFSPYTLAGHTILGGGVEATPGILRFGFVYGRLQRATAVDTTSGSLEPFAYTRRGYALKLGIGKGGRSLDFSLMKGKDDSTSVEHAPLMSYALNQRPVTPAENTVFGVSVRLPFLRTFFWEADGGLSFYTRHLGSSVALDSAETLLPSLLTHTLGRLMHINGTSEFYSAYQTSVGYRGKGFSLRVQYRRVDPGYQSMGAYFFNNDVENLTLAPSFVMLKQRVRFSGSVGVQRDNLQQQKQATSRRVIGAANLSADITEQLGLDINFTNFSTNQRARTILIADSFLLAQTTRNLSITPRYIVTHETTSHALMLSYNRTSLLDQNPRSEADNTLQSSNAFLNYQLTFVQRGLSLSANLNRTQLKRAAGVDGNRGVTLNASQRLADNRLSVGVNASFLRSLQQNQPGKILNQGVRLDWQAHPMHRFNALVNLIGNYPDAPTAESYNRRYTEFRGELGYHFSF